MNPAIKKVWVEALRSRKFKQGGGYLKCAVGKHAEYCCLGVLREVSPIKLNAVRNEEDGPAYLSVPSLKKVGLTHETQELLACMNDGVGPFESKRKGFAAIATYIEKNL